MEEVAVALNGVVVFVCQVLAIFVISIGIIKALVIYVKDALFGQEAMLAINESRLELGHAFSLGLGFLIGSSILKTTIAPTWDDIGQLAAIITIRTALNYFLLKDIGKGFMHKAQLGANENGLIKKEKIDSGKLTTVACFAKYLPFLTAVFEDIPLELF